MDVQLILSLWNELGWFGKALAALLALHPVASVIVAVTDTPKDDKLYGKFYRLILMPVALNVGKAFDKGAHK